MEVILFPEWGYDRLWKIALSISIQQCYKDIELTWALFVCF